ncbi:MAG: hypothetical protein JNG85_09935, partial [Spirochaetaceae bacterium]|nr:hypothetical protein [Spirochaetaceae bacterium]
MGFPRHAPRRLPRPKPLSPRAFLRAAAPPAQARAGGPGGAQGLRLFAALRGLHRRAERRDSRPRQSRLAPRLRPGRARGLRGEAPGRGLVSRAARALRKSRPPPPFARELVPRRLLPPRRSGGAVSLIFHVDLDAFFASVEQLDHEEYRGRPVVVGAAPGRRGVVSTCSYEARAFGIRSAMPISEAYRRCPGAVFLPVRMERYAELSRIVMETFGEFSPDVRPLSIDEAFLDMTGTERLTGPARGAATALKARVRERTGLGISVGA